MKLDPTALFSISYGLYIITSHDGQRDCGFVSNSVMQLTADPIRLAVSVNKQNHTASAIEKSIYGKFSQVILPVLWMEEIWKEEKKV